MQIKTSLIFVILLGIYSMPLPSTAEGSKAHTRAVHGSDYHIDLQSTTEITGLWWNKNEPGWGITLTQQYDIIFATMYTYNQDGTPKWYVASNCAVINNGCSGKLYEISGGSVLTSPWDGASKSLSEAGHVSFLFSDASTGTMDFTIGKDAGTRVITRQLFSTLSPDAPFTALWWNENESGWGVTLTQQTNIAFITLFTYDNSGLPTWYVASNCAVTGNSCSGTLYEVVGGSHITSPWDDSSKMTSEAGDVTFDFSDPDTGTLSFNINGMSGTKSISRQVWANSSTSNALNAGLRNFALPVPLFDEGSVWNQSVLTAQVLPNSEASILTTYRVLRGDISDQRPVGSVQPFNWPYVILNYDE